VSSIDKQRNGHWKARYRDRGGHSHSKTFLRRADAQSFLDDIGHDMRRGQWIDPKLARIPFEQWADRWWGTTTKLRPTTRRGYWGMLQRHVRPYFEGWPLSDITYMDVEDFITHLLAKGLSPKHTRDCVSILSLVMKTAVRANVRKDNRAADHHIPIPRRKLHEGDVLNMEQVHLLVAHVKDPYKPAVWLLMLAGLRPAELCGLRVCDVDFKKHVIHVSQTVLPVHSFDSEGFGLVTGPPKTSAGDRRIPIPAWLCGELAGLVAARRDRNGIGGGADRKSEFLFQTRYGNPLNRDKLREKVIRPALREAGLPETFRTYDLRHSHASVLIHLGVNLLALAQRMGHSDPAMTLRLYGHLFEGAQVQLSEKIDALRAATEPMSGTVVPFARQPKSHKEATHPGPKFRLIFSALNSQS
jgi:integrase